MKRPRKCLGHQTLFEVYYSKTFFKFVNRKLFQQLRIYKTFVQANTKINRVFAKKTRDLK